MQYGSHARIWRYVCRYTVSIPPPIHQLDPKNLDQSHFIQLFLNIRKNNQIPASFALNSIDLYVTLD